MRNHQCIHDMPNSIVAHRSKYGQFSWLDYEPNRLKQPCQGLGRPYMDNGDDRRLTCAYTKHFHHFRSPLKVLVPRANVWGCLSHIMVAQRLAVTVGCRQWPKNGRTKYLCVCLEEVHTSMIKTDDRRRFPKWKSGLKDKNCLKIQEKTWILILYSAPVNQAIVTR